MGGMTKAVETGMPKLRIEEAAARRQARIDRGEEIIVGVNKYRPRGAAASRSSTSTTRRCARPRSRGLQQIRAARDAAARARRRSRRSPKRRARAGQPARALDRRGARARHRGRDLRRAGARLHAATAPIDPLDLRRLWRRLRRATRTSTRRSATSTPSPKSEGRRPRLLVVKLGQDGHDRGAKVIATAFADLGFDVDIGPLFQTPEEAARQAVENDVHVVGVSSQAAGHKTLVPAAARALTRRGRRTTSSSSWAASSRPRTTTSAARRRASPPSTAPAPTSRSPRARSSP